jgi:hypothetical protein
VPLQPEILTEQSPKKSRSEARTEKVESSIDFDWETLIEFTKKNYVALYSVLSKCIADNQPGKLTLYTKSTFYKKKLDDVKYRSHLFESLKQLWSYEPSIHTVPTAPPPSSSQAASVAVIMGGGEEVSVEAS